MLVIIKDDIVQNKLRKEDLATITKYAGVFQIAIKVIQKGTGDRYTSRRWAADLSEPHLLQILKNNPDLSLRVDELVQAQFHTCDDYPDKYYHLD